jgi:siderophore synthetase component
VINGDPEKKVEDAPAAAGATAAAAAAPAKTAPSRAITPEKFAANFAYAHAILIQLTELLRSVEAQFTSFLEMELRNIPERVIKKLEADVEEAEAAATAPAGSAPAKSSAAAKKAADNGDDSD